MRNFETVALEIANDFYERFNDKINFNDFDLYANVTGRVDNDTLRYTSTTELQTFSGMQEGFQQPKQQYQVAPTTQARTSRPSTTAKIPAKQRKRPTRGGRGGGY